MKKLLGIAALTLGTLSVNAQAQVALVTFATGTTEPVDIQNAGDSRLFIVEKPGTIVISDDMGNISPDPFLDIQGRVKDQGGEQGLLGLAFHPDYSTNGYFYVNYTKPGDSTVISRFSVTSNPDSADPNSEQILMTLYQPFTNHNAGQLAFGPDGYLYIGTGDGGSAGDPGNRSQDSLNFLGKMLRIDVDGGSPYAIPNDNPFVGNPDGLDEIWATGLRNPWRYAFDPANGDLWIADVGQNAWEEIHKQPGNSTGGENYGWRCYEGNQPYNLSGCSSDSTLYTFPVHEYSHNSPDFGCSITGGYVYRGGETALQGWYFYVDLCNRQLHGVKETSPGIYTDYLAYTSPSETLVSFGVDQNEEMYVCGLYSGNIYHIVIPHSVPELRSEQFTIYPNPASQTVTIDRKGYAPIDRLEVYALNGGKVIDQGVSTTGPIDVNVSNINSGVYIVNLITEDGQQIKKKLVIR